MSLRYHIIPFFATTQKTWYLPQSTSPDEGKGYKPSSNPGIKLHTSEAAKEPSSGLSDDGSIFFFTLENFNQAIQLYHAPQREYNPPRTDADQHHL